MIWYQELSFIQNWKLLLTLVPFNYHWYFCRMLISNQSHIFYSLLEGAALLEALLGGHGRGAVGRVAAGAAATGRLAGRGAQEGAQGHRQGVF